MGRYRDTKGDIGFRALGFRGIGFSGLSCGKPRLLKKGSHGLRLWALLATLRKS